MMSSHFRRYSDICRNLSYFATIKLYKHTSFLLLSHLDCHIAPNCLNTACTHLNCVVRRVPLSLFSLARQTYSVARYPVAWHRTLFAVWSCAVPAATWLQRSASVGCHLIQGEGYRWPDGSDLDSHKHVLLSSAYSKVNSSSVISFKTQVSKLQHIREWRDAALFLMH